MRIRNQLDRALFLALTVVTLLSLLPPAVAKDAQMSVSSVRATLRLFETVSPHSTLTRVKMLMPKGSRVTSVASAATIAEQGRGTWVEFDGTIAGTMTFLSAIQKKALQKLEDGDTRPNPQLRYKRTDPINAIYLIMVGRNAGPNTAKGRDSADAQRMTLLKSILGRPTWQAWGGSDMGHGSGWRATWRRHDGRHISYAQDVQGETQLTLTFPYSVE